MIWPHPCWGMCHSLNTGTIYCKRRSKQSCSHAGKTLDMPSTLRNLWPGWKKLLLSMLNFFWGYLFNLVSVICCPCNWKLRTVSILTTYKLLSTVWLEHQPLSHTTFQKPLTFYLFSNFFMLKNILQSATIFIYIFRKTIEREKKFCFFYSQTSHHSPSMPRNGLRPSSGLLGFKTN